MNPTNTQLFRKQGTTQAVDSLGNLQNFSGNLDELPVFNNNVITPESLAPQPKIQLPQTPQPTPTQPSPAQNMVTDLLKQYDLSQTEQQAQNFQNQGLEQYLKDIVGLQGETQALAEERQKAGVGTLRQDLQNLNSQILKKQAELQQDDIQLVSNMRAEERRDTLLPFAQMGQAKLAGDAQILRALKNAEIGVLNAQALAKQGDIALAQQTAEEAVAIKYAPYKERIKAYEDIVKALQPFLTSAEKKEANKQQLKGQLAMREIEKAEKEETKGSEYLITAIQGKAPANLIAKAQSLINSGAKASEVARVLGAYSMSLADRLDIELKQKQIDKLNAEVVQKNPDAGELVKINGKDYIRYKDGTISDPVLPDAGDLNLVVSRLNEKLKTVGRLTKPSVGLVTSAGSARGAPIPFLAKNAINNWRADAINIIQKLTVDELGRVKSDGVTFGQLSNGERQAVGDAATALGAASIRDKDGNPTGRFKMSEKKVIEKFQKIYDGYALDFEKRTGIPYEIYLQNPESIKEKVADDFIDEAGTALISNSIYGNYPTQ